MSVAHRIVAIIEEMSGKEANFDSRLLEDLELDSLDRIALAMELENQFGIEIPDDDVDRPALGVVRGLVDYVEEKVREKYACGGPVKAPPYVIGERPSESFVHREGVEL